MNTALQNKMEELSDAIRTKGRACHQLTRANFFEKGFKVAVPLAYQERDRQILELLRSKPKFDENPDVSPSSMLAAWLETKLGEHPMCNCTNCEMSRWWESRKKK